MNFGYLSYKDHGCFFIYFLEITDLNDNVSFYINIARHLFKCELARTRKCFHFRFTHNVNAKIQKILNK